MTFVTSAYGVPCVCSCAEPVALRCMPCGRCLRQAPAQWLCACGQLAAQPLCASADVVRWCCRGIWHAGLSGCCMPSYSAAQLDMHCGAARVPRHQPCQCMSVLLGWQCAANGGRGLGSHQEVMIEWNAGDCWSLVSVQQTTRAEMHLLFGHLIYCAHGSRLACCACTASAG